MQYRGKIIMVGEHAVQIPEPDKRSDIFFINEKKENQYWDRAKVISQYKQVWFDFIPSYTKMWQNATIYNNDGILVSLNETDSDYIDSIYRQEVDRRINGVHFMNNGEVTWITGDHYFFLMYAAMQRHDGKGNYADYREFQRDYAYLIHHVCVSENILGLFCSKAKKTGITNFHWSGFYLNRATLYKNKNLGYMNINQGQAAKTFVDYFMYSYNRLISPLKPTYKRLSEVDGTILFADSYSNSKKVKAPNANNENDLNTSVFCVATEPKAFDVAVMWHVTMDEPTKYKKSFGEIFRTNQQSVKIQSKFNGRMWLFNYTPEDDSDSFNEAREIFRQSELKTINEYSKGQTKSGLINFHIPAYNSWEGAVDKYGKCDHKKAMEEIAYERKKVEKDKRALQAIIRQYANDKREAWGSGGSSSVFDPVRLATLEIELDEYQRTGKTFEQGKLEWAEKLWESGKKDKRPKGVFGHVRLVKLTDDEIKAGKQGRLREYYPMPDDWKNMPLSQGRDEYNNVLPPKKFNMVGAIDPTDFRGNVGEGSEDSMHCMPVHNDITNLHNGRTVTKVFSLEYFFRPDNPEEFYQDVVKFIIYTGALVIVEANNAWLAERLEDEGLGHYMMWKDVSGNLSLYRANHKGSRSPLKTIRTLKQSGGIDTVADMILYLRGYLQEADPDYNEIDYGRTIRSERLIGQLMVFDPDDTRKFDLVMTAGYCLIAHENYMALINRPVDGRYDVSQVRAVLSALESL